MRYPNEAENFRRDRRAPAISVVQCLLPDRGVNWHRVELNLFARYVYTDEEKQLKVVRGKNLTSPWREKAHDFAPNLLQLRS
jgi:hypothetical protein